MRTDIVALILELTKDKTMSTSDLQTKTNLSPAKLNQILELLVTKGLIRTTSGNKGKVTEITPTERGIAFLELYNAIKMKYLTVSSTG